MVSVDRRARVRRGAPLLSSPRAAEASWAGTKRRTRIIQEAFAVCLLAVLTFGQLLSLLSDLSGRVPSDLIDPLYNVWSVALSVHQVGALGHDPASLLGSNIFYPTPHAAIYGDVFIGLLPLSLPLHMIGVDPVALTNSLVVLSFFLSGYGAFLLGRQLTGHYLAGLCAAIVFIEAPVRWDHAGHLSVQSSEWLIFGVWALTIAWSRDSLRWWSLAGLLGGLTAVTNLYVLAYLSLPTLVTAIVGVRHWTARRLLGAILATVIALGLVIPLAVVYLGRHAQLGATYGSTASTDVVSLLTVFQGRLVDQLLVPTMSHVPLSATNALFPGCTVLALTALGIQHRQRSPDRQGGMPLPWVVFGVCCLIVVLGHHLVIAGHAFSLVLPWGLVTALVHPLAAFRSPSQAAIGVSLGCSALCAYGVMTLEQALRRHCKRRHVTWPVALVVALLVVESWQQLPSVGVVPVARGDAWLGRHYPNQPALALPLGTETPRDWLEQTRIMYDSTASWTPLVNGQASVVPDTMHAPLAILATYPSPTAQHMLRHLGVHLVLVYWPWVSLPRRRLLAQLCCRVYEDSLQWIYRV